MSNETQSQQSTSPLYPVSPGSVLSQFLDSFNPFSTRTPTMVQINANSGKLSTKAQTHKSKIPLKQCPQTPQGNAFAKSLRQYCHSSKITPSSTPGKLSRAVSPTFGVKKLGDTAAASKRYEPRPVRLAYGINGSYYQKSLKSASQQNSYTSDDERRIRMLHTQAVVKIEAEPTCTRDGEILSSCRHEEKACQVISAEFLKMPGKRSDAALEDESKGKLTKEDGVYNDSLDISCGIMMDMQKTIDFLTYQNERLELQLFEMKEKLLEFEGQKNNSQVVVIEDKSTGTEFKERREIGQLTDESFSEKLQFPLKSFLRPYLHVREGDNNNGEEVAQGKRLALGLAAREAFLNELISKVKKGNRILLKRYNDIKRGDDKSLFSGNSNHSLEADPLTGVLESYRKFLNFIYTYMERSLLDLEEFDGRNAKNSKHYYDTTMNMDGVCRKGVFIPVNNSSSIKWSKDILEKDGVLPEKGGNVMHDDGMRVLFNSPIISGGDNGESHEDIGMREELCGKSKKCAAKFPVYKDMF